MIHENKRIGKGSYEAVHKKTTSPGNQETALSRKCRDIRCTLA
jgi:hypothetical protein